MANPAPVHETYDELKHHEEDKADLFRGLLHLPYHMSPNMFANYDPSGGMSRSKFAIYDPSGGGYATGRSNYEPSVSSRTVALDALGHILDVDAAADNLPALVHADELPYVHIPPPAPMVDNFAYYHLHDPPPAPATPAPPYDEEGKRITDHEWFKPWYADKSVCPKRITREMVEKSIAKNSNLQVDAIKCGVCNNGICMQVSNTEAEIPYFHIIYRNELCPEYCSRGSLCHNDITVDDDAWIVAIMALTSFDTSAQARSAASGYLTENYGPRIEPMD